MEFILVELEKQSESADSKSADSKSKKTIQKFVDIYQLQHKTLLKEKVIKEVKMKIEKNKVSGNTTPTLSNSSKKQTIYKANEKNEIILTQDMSTTNEPNNGLKEY